MRIGKLRAACVVAVLGIIASGCSSEDAESVSYPATQQAFYLLNEQCRQNFIAGKNEIQKSLAFNQCNKERLQFSKEKKIVGWVGQISDISTDQGADAVSVTIKANIGGFDVSFGTLGNRLSDYGSDSMITQSNPLFAVLAGMSVGDTVAFDARFLPHPEGKRGIWESSLTEQGSMEDPEFSVRFSDIRLYRAEIMTASSSVDATKTDQVDAAQSVESEFKSDGADASEASQIDCSGPQSQIESNICASQELDSETAAINSVYDRYRAILSVSEQQALKREELVWIKDKDATCEEASSDVAAGSMHSQVLADCLIEATKARRTKLEELLRCREEPSSSDNCLSVDRAETVMREWDGEIASLTGMKYGDSKRLLKKAGYKIDPYIDSDIFNLSFDGTAASCGNAGCSVQWLLPQTQKRICVNAHMDERLPESEMQIAVVEGKCE